MSIFDFRKKPNKDQQAFIDDFENNILLFAPAGSGKTFSIAKKIEKALSKGDLLPKDILCLTYTEKARDEMQSDIAYYDTHNFTNVFTIHGFCLRTLIEEAKKSGSYYADMRIIDKDETEELIRNELLPSFSRKVSNSLLKKRFNRSLDEYKKENIVYIGKEKIIWKEGENYTDCFGRRMSEERVLQYREEMTCPYCNRPISDFYCKHCDTDLYGYFPVPDQFYFEFYEFMTKVRHQRELYRIFTDDPEQDFSETIRQMKTNDKLYRSCMVQSKSKPVSEFVFSDLMDEFGGWLVASFLSLCEEKHAIDFDQMIIGTLHLFEKGIAKRDFKLILVDEMQDTSELEFRVLSHLFHHAQIIFCGDYFQTIYEWRGSKPDRIIGVLKRDYLVKEYYFKENYRSTQLLSEASQSYLKNAFPNHEHIANTSVHSKEEGEKIHCFDFDTEELQAIWLYDTVRKINGTACFMCRSNFTANELYHRLAPISKDIIFFSQDEQKKFYLNPSLKDFLAFLHLLVDPYDEISMERITQRYIKGIGKKRLNVILEQKEYRLTDFLFPETYENEDYYSFYSYTTFVVYDLETTGLDVSKDELLQIAAIKFDRFGNELARLNELVIPSVPISEGALHTHHKSSEELNANGTKDIKGVLKGFLAFSKGSYLFGHNSTAFDRMILHRQLFENNLPLPDVVGEGDTLLLAKRLLPTLPNHKLETLCNLFSIVNENAHDAFSDVKATKEVFLHLAHCLPIKDNRLKFYQTYRSSFEKFYLKYAELKQRINEGDGKGILDELFAIITSKKNNANDKVFFDRWNTIRTIFPKRVDCLIVAIKSFLEESNNTDKQLEKLSETNQVIPIVTVHQTKGCEFDHVFLFDADDERFPSIMALRSGQEKEERRLFYVAMTRAKKSFSICYVRNSTRYPGSLNDPTRYVAFIDRKYMDYSSK